MNWKDIKISADNTHFIVDNKNIFNKIFIEVLKYHAPGIAPVLDETGAYHIDTQGNPLYPEKYNRAFGFYCNRAAVTINHEWFHIDVQGKRIYKEVYAWIGNFQEDRCTVRTKEGMYFHVDLHGTPCYTDKYIYAGDFKDGVACVKQLDGWFRHIDKQGHFIHDKVFVDLGVFHKNYATARDGMGWFHIDKGGNELYTQRYQLVEPFYNGQALVTQLDGQKIILDEEGLVLLELR
jgi:hypothetical protein